MISILKNLDNSNILNHTTWSNWICWTTHKHCECKKRKECLFVHHFSCITKFLKSCRITTQDCVPKGYHIPCNTFSEFAAIAFFLATYQAKIILDFSKFKINHSTLYQTTTVNWPSYTERICEADINTLPKDKILNLSKLKAPTEDKINVTEKLTFVVGRVENLEGKGENAGNQHFLLFQQCFQKAFFFLWSLKVRD